MNKAKVLTPQEPDTTPLIATAKTRYGKMQYLTKDTYVGESLRLYGEYSEGEADIFRAILKPRDTVIEVGANIGALTLPIAEAVGRKGRVFAYEPQPQCYKLLKANTAHTCATCVQAAVGKLPKSSLTIPYIDYGVTGNFGAVALSETVEGVSVCGVCLDSDCAELYFPYGIRLIKIDVEGMEADVISGAKVLIATYHPIIYCESDRVNKHAELCQLLRSLYYDLYWHTPPLFNPDNFAKNKNNIFPNLASFNMLCVPKGEPLPKGYENLIPVDKDGNIHPLKRNDVAHLAPPDASVEQLAASAKAAQDQGQFEAAEKLYSKAITESSREEPVLWRRRAECLESLGFHAQAVQSASYGLSLMPNDAIGQFQLGCYYGFLGEREKSRMHTERAIDLSPTLAGARWNYALSDLQLGNWVAGWHEFEWRKCLGTTSRRIPTSEWDGRHLDDSGEPLVICHEQGIGDMIQFMRLTLHPIFKKATEEVHTVLEVPTELVPILHGWPGVGEVIGIREDAALVVPTSRYISLMSLPYALNLREEWHPGFDYLASPFAQPQGTPGEGKLRVGLVWKSRQNNNWRDRHMRAEQMDALASVPGVEAFSLVYGAQDAPQGCHKPTLHSWRDTMLWANHMDLIIAVDGAVAHLAAAMGKPVWTILAYASDWRWGIGKETTGWYPSMTLKRQQEFGKWDTLIESIRCDLIAKAKEKIDA